MSEIVSDLDSPEGRPGTGATLRSALDAAAKRRPKQRDLRPLRRLAPIVRAHSGDALAAGFFLVLSTAASLSLTGAARMVVDSGLITAKGGLRLGPVFLILCAVALVQAIAAGARFYFITRLGERVVADLRKTIYRHILTLDQGQFVKIRTGEVLSRMTTDIAIVETLVGSSSSMGLRNLLSFVGALTLMIIVNPHMTLVVLLLIPVVLVPLVTFGRRVRRLSVQAQDRFADAVGYAGETLDALDTLQAFGREASATARFGAAVETAFDASKARILARALLTSLVMIMVFAAVAAILWMGVQQVHRGEMTAGSLFQFILLSVLAAGAVSALGEVWGDVQKGAGAMERISELLDARPEIVAPAHPVPLPTPARGAIAFEHVAFAYPGRPDLPALRGVSFAIRPGERVALVGPSGAGKSTVLRLLLRFYDPTSGIIRIDGVNLKDADPAEARARMALVAQDAPLFSGSALDNIRFGRADADLDAARAAAHAAQADSFLDALPHGFDTPVGERAKTLSGGQRQRLAIARALVREAPILLLDEATSALDAENEGLVQKALDEAMVGRTTLVIAHRLATVLRADRILVLDEGRIVEEGNHADLVARGGLYARLARLQFSTAA